MMKVENFIPQPFRDISSGDKEVKAGKATGGRDIFTGAKRSLAGKAHLALATLFMGASLVAQRYLRFGGAAVRIATAVISLPAALIHEGFRAVISGLKSLPSAVMAKNALGIGKSAAYMGGGLLLLEASSNPLVRDLGLFEEFALPSLLEKQYKRVLTA